MNLVKITKDYIVKLLQGGSVVPRELLELHDYFRYYKVITFDFKKSGDLIIAESTDFKHGSIITSGSNRKELDKNIRDAILTAFSLPSAYLKEANIIREGDAENAYVLA